MEVVPHINTSIIEKGIYTRQDVTNGTRVKSRSIIWHTRENEYETIFNILKISSLLLKLMADDVIIVNQM